MTMTSNTVAVPRDNVPLAKSDLAFFRRQGQTTTEDEDQQSILECLTISTVADFTTIDQEESDDRGSIASTEHDLGNWSMEFPRDDDGLVLSMDDEDSEMIFFEDYEDDDIVGYNTQEYGYDCDSDDDSTIVDIERILSHETSSLDDNENEEDCVDSRRWNNFFRDCRDSNKQTACSRMINPAGQVVVTTEASINDNTMSSRRRNIFRDYWQKKSIGNKNSSRDNTYIETPHPPPLTTVDINIQEPSSMERKPPCETIKTKPFEITNPKPKYYPKRTGPARGMISSRINAAGEVVAVGSSAKNIRKPRSPSPSRTLQSDYEQWLMENDDYVYEKWRIGLHIQPESDWIEHIAKYHNINNNTLLADPTMQFGFSRLLQPCH